MARKMVGVRVILDLDWGGPTPPGMRNTASIVFNVLSTASKRDIIAFAEEAWNTHAVKLAQPERYTAIAVDGQIVQIIEAGFPQAQVNLE